MAPREALYRLVNVLPESKPSTATRILEALVSSSDPVARSMAMAPIDDEPDDDDFDGGLTEARQEAAESRLIAHEEIERVLGLR